MCACVGLTISGFKSYKNVSIPAGRLSEAHNVVVGRHTAMAACVGVAGSASIGAHCTIGGAAVVLGHLEVADHVNISAASVVTRSIRKAGHYTGLFPIDDNAQWEKNAAALKRLHSLRERLRALEKRSQDKSTP